MGTCNFCYENRCVVVTNEDYEDGNVPAHRTYDKSSLRSYPSYILDDSNFEFWNVVLTAGYYADSCIDYKPKLGEYGEDVVTHTMPSAYWYSSVTELIEDLVDMFELSRYRVRKLIGKLSECKDLECFCERAFCRVNEYLSELEEVKVNEFIDQIKEEYGYSEYGVLGIFNNGEAVYSKIE